jgi:hypothetical protein
MRLLYRATPLMAALTLAACASLEAQPPNAIVLPALPAWYEGRLVRYVVTDISNADMARMMGANTAPRLGDALPAVVVAGTARPRHAVERVYKVLNPEQPAVFPSIPAPLGPDSRDRVYSPVWRVVEARWQPDRTVRELKSEEEVLKAAERADVVLTVTEVVINCPVVWVEGQPPLPGTRLLYERALDKR